ncbi:MAG: hypothetical protein AMXMBFR52_13640 [Burkholderiales bacterium]|jgi:hypothetical protein|nr:hypothetical protein [Burkholderiaceae bacterium]
MGTAIGTATFFHAGCPVCVSAGTQFIDALDHIDFGVSLAGLT